MHAATAARESQRRGRNPPVQARPGRRAASRRNAAKHRGDHRRIGEGRRQIEKLHCDRPASPPRRRLGGIRRGQVEIDQRAAAAGTSAKMDALLERRRATHPRPPVEARISPSRIDGRLPPADSEKRPFWTPLRASAPSGSAGRWRGEFRSQTQRRAADLKRQDSGRIKQA